MQIISVILAIPVTVILVLWIKKLKKDDPFPKGSILLALIHTVYDSSVTAVKNSDSYLVFELACIVAMCALFVLSIIKIIK